MVLNTVQSFGKTLSSTQYEDDPMYSISVSSTYNPYTLTTVSQLLLNAAVQLLPIRPQEIIIIVQSKNISVLFKY